MDLAMGAGAMVTATQRPFMTTDSKAGTDSCSKAPMHPSTATRAGVPSTTGSFGST
jgi:hypothetical protein